MSILSFSGPRWTTRHLTLAAMLTALEVILGKMSVGNPTVLKVSLGFIATALVGYCLGPWLGGMVMIVNDLISNTPQYWWRNVLSRIHILCIYHRGNCRFVLIQPTCHLATNFHLRTVPNRRN